MTVCCFSSDKDLLIPKLMYPLLPIHVACTDIIVSKHIISFLPLYLTIFLTETNNVTKDTLIGVINNMHWLLEKSILGAKVPCSIT